MIGGVIEPGAAGVASAGFLALRQACSQDAFLSMARLRTSGLHMGSRFPLAPDAMEPHSVEIRKDDPGADKARRQYCCAETSEHGSAHNSMITRRAVITLSSGELSYGPTAVYVVYSLYLPTFEASVKSRISKWGNSLAIRIPKHLGSEIELAEGTEIDLTVLNGSIIITPVSSNYQLEELVRGITPENRHTETEWGAPKGTEVW